MELPAILLPYLEPVLNWWRSLGPAGPYYVWIASGVLGFTFLVAVWYRFFRKLLGHRKFRGTWYNPYQFQELVNILNEDQESGRRVMQHDEIALLRSWKYGMKGGIGFDKANGYDLK
jgi:hypothetical protein